MPRTLADVLQAFFREDLSLSHGRCEGLRGLVVVTSEFQNMGDSHAAKVRS